MEFSMYNYLFIIFTIIIISFYMFYKYETFINYPKENDKLKYLRNYTLPRTIYTYFNKMNPIIEANINNWKRKLPGWKIVVITDENLKNYISQDFINKYKDNLIPAHFSDFLRFYLIYNNGGLWIDGGVFIINGIFIEYIYKEMINNKYEVFMFEYKIKTMNKRTPHLETWLIMAPKYSRLLGDIYKEFDQAFDMGFLNYKERVLVPGNINLNNTIEYKKKIYLIVYAIINYLMLRNKYNILSYDASYSMYFLQNKFYWDHKKIIDFIINTEQWKHIYGVKLTSKNRKAIKDIRKYVDKINSL